MNKEFSENKVTVPNLSRDEAVSWYIKLNSEVATESDKILWLEWKNSNSENYHAWQRIERIVGEFRKIPSDLSKASSSTLNTNLDSKDRRQALKILGIFIGVGTISVGAYQEKPWRIYAADYVTAKGVQRHIILADNTQLYLNTDTAIDIQFDAKRRIVKLYSGEVLIETGQDDSNPYRPFILVTDDGTVTALGTRFSIRKYKGYSIVTVFDDAVRVESNNYKVIVSSKESLKFSNTSQHFKEQADMSSDKWVSGYILADKMKLGEFLDEVSRYRYGIIRCDPSAADLVISGSFPIRETNAIFLSLVQVLPVKVNQYTKYWTHVSAI